MSYHNLKETKCGKQFMLTKLSFAVISPHKYISLHDGTCSLPNKDTLTKLRETTLCNNLAMMELRSNLHTWTSLCWNCHGQQVMHFHKSVHIHNAVRGRPFPQYWPEFFPHFWFCGRIFDFWHTGEQIRGSRDWVGLKSNTCRICSTALYCLHLSETGFVCPTMQALGRCQMQRQKFT